MKILFAANEFIEHGKPKTGFPNYLYRVARALQSMGNNVVVVTCGNSTRHRFIDGIEVWEVEMHYSGNNNQWMNVVVNNFKASMRINKKINKILAKNEIDIIQFTSLMGMPLLYFGQTPSVMRLSSYAKKAYPTFETLNKDTVRIMSLIERIAGRHCNAVFAPSIVTARAYEEDFNRKVYVIESPFMNDVKELDDKIIKYQLNGKKYVLFFGNMYYEKGILTIVDIIERFLKNNSEYIWVFAGKALSVNGINAAKLLSDAAGKYRERVVFLGELMHEQLYPVIQHADFVVLPSIMENLSNACIEAMYYSKIVIGTDGASFEQLIDNRVSGFLCKIDDSADLLAKMQEVVDLPDDRRRKMECRAHKRIERLAPEIAVKQLLKFYEAVLRTTK